MVWLFLLQLGTFITVAASTSIQPSNECHVLLKEAYQSMRLLGTDIPMQKIYYMDYSVETTLRGQQNQASKERIQAWYARDFAIVKSPTVDIFQDQNDFFAISHLQKKVVWTSAAGQLGQRERFKHFSNLQDSLLKHGQIISCNNVNWAGKITKQLKWQCTNRGQSYLNVQAITYWISPESKQLLKALIHYGKEGNIDTYTIEIHKIDLNHEPKPIQLPVRTSLIDEQKRLKKPYSNYKLLDSKNR